MATLVHPALIPQSHLDLLTRPLLGRLSSLLPNGYAQTHPVWYDFAADWPRINTMRGFRKHRNMTADPRVTLLIVDPQNTNRWIEVRGSVELSEDGAVEHLDSLAWRYAHVRHYVEIVPESFGSETPVLGRIRPLRVVTNDLADARAHATTRRVEPLAVSYVDTRDVVPVPATHRDLLSGPHLFALTTFMPDGHPQTQPVWADFDGRCVRINTTLERRKGRNLEENPRATVLVVDPQNSNRWLEVRGDVLLVTEGAEAHLDHLTRIYAGHEHFYGSIYPEDFRERETRVICLLHPRHIVCDAIHP